MTSISTASACQKSWTVCTRVRSLSDSCSGAMKRAVSECSSRHVLTKRSAKLSSAPRGRTCRARRRSARRRRVARRCLRGRCSCGKSSCVCASRDATVHTSVDGFAVPSTVVPGGDGGGDSAGAIASLSSAAHDPSAAMVTRVCCVDARPGGNGGGGRSGGCVDDRVMCGGTRSGSLGGSSNRERDCACKRSLADGDNTGGGRPGVRGIRVATCASRFKSTFARGGDTDAAEHGAWLVALFFFKSESWLMVALRALSADSAGRAPFERLNDVVLSTASYMGTKCALSATATASRACTSRCVKNDDPERLVAAAATCGSTASSAGNTFRDRAAGNTFRDRAAGNNRDGVRPKALAHRSARAARGSNPRPI